MKKLFSLLVLVLAVAFTSQAENGAGNDNGVMYENVFDLPSAEAIVDNSFAQPNPHTNVTTVVVNYTSEGGLEVAKIINDSGIQDYSDTGTPSSNTELAVITNRNYELYEQITSFNSNTERKTDKNTSLNSTKSSKRIAANVGKFNSNI